MERDDIIIMLVRLGEKVEYLTKQVEDFIKKDFIKRSDFGSLLDDHLKLRSEKNITKTNNLFTLLKNIGYGITWFLAIGAMANGILHFFK